MADNGTDRVDGGAAAAAQQRARHGRNAINVALAPLSRLLCAIGPRSVQPPMLCQCSGMQHSIGEKKKQKIQTARERFPIFAGHFCLP